VRGVGATALGRSSHGIRTWRMSAARACETQGPSLKGLRRRLFCGQRSVLGLQEPSLRGKNRPRRKVVARSRIRQGQRPALLRRRGEQSALVPLGPRKISPNLARGASSQRTARATLAHSVALWWDLVAQSEQCSLEAPGLYGQLARTAYRRTSEGAGNARRRTGRVAGSRAQG